jgi:prepilin-type N-terminal cleavage/methylation domain-containing protein
MRKQHITFKNGFTLVEILMALAVGALLLVAVMVAFNGAAMNYSENQAISDTINNARQFLYKIIQQLRTAKSVESVSDTRCSFTDDYDNSLTYSYDTDSSSIKLTKDSTEYLVCENVSDIKFTKTVSDQDPNVVKSIRIDMEVTQNGSARKLSSGTSIRKNLE